VKKLQLLPPNHRGRAYEHVGLRIREFAGVSIHEPLDPFTLAPFAKIAVIRPKGLATLPRPVLKELTRRCRSNWSAVTLALPDGTQLCIINPPTPSSGPTRP
jgi:hypothetical protein